MWGNVLLFLIKAKNQSSRISRGKRSACARVHSPNGVALHCLQTGSGPLLGRNFSSWSEEKDRKAKEASSS